MRRRSSRTHTPSDCSPTLNSRATSAIDRPESMTRCAASTLNSVVNFLRLDMFDILPASAQCTREQWMSTFSGEPQCSPAPGSRSCEVQCEPHGRTRSSKLDRWLPTRTAEPHPSMKPTPPSPDAAQVQGAPQRPSTAPLTPAGCAAQAATRADSRSRRGPGPPTGTDRWCSPRIPSQQDADQILGAHGWSACIFRVTASMCRGTDSRFASARIVGRSVSNSSMMRVLVLSRPKRCSDE